MTIRSASIVFALAAVTLGAVVFSQSAHIAPIPGKQSILAQAATYPKLSEAKDSVFKSKVTFEFKNARLAFVVEEFTSKNVKLSVSPDLADEIISLSFENITLGQALDQVASLVDGAWQRNGNTFTLKRKEALALAPLRLQQGRNVQAPMMQLEDLPLLTPLPGLRSIKIEQDGKKKKVTMSPIEDKSDPIDHVELEIEGDKVVRGFYFDKDAKAPRAMSKAQIDLYQKAMDQHAKEWEKWGEQHSKHWEQWSKDVEKQWENWGEQFGKNWEQWGEQFGKHWEEWAKQWEKSGKSWEDMTPEEKAKFEKDMERFRIELNKELKNMPNVKMAPHGFHFNVPDLPEGMFKFVMPENMSKEERAKFEQEMQQWKEELRNSMKEFKDAKSHVFVLPPNGSFKMVAPEKMSKEQRDAWERDVKAWREEVEKTMKNMPKEGFKVMPPEVPKLDSAPKAPKVINFDDLYSSMSADQVTLMKERGYLYWSDLTEKQRSMIGTEFKGDFNITITQNDKTISIRSNPK